MTTATTQLGARSQPRATRPTWLQRAARRAALGALDGVTGACIEIDDGAERIALGDAASEMRGRAIIRDPGAWPALAFGATIGAGDAYTDGLWDSPDLTTLYRALLRAGESLDRLHTGLPARLAAPLRTLAYRMERNSRPGARRNIAAHYDLSNEFFALWLDETMMYSCAMWPSGVDDLHTAQLVRLETICRRLDLRPEHHLIEIGTGWGGLAIYAAATRGCRVTTTTISSEQARFARDRIERAGLADRIEVLENDYRDLSGAYDRLVSIEMIEAVGREYLGDYMRRVSSLLTPDGQALIQAITIRDHRWARAARTRDWLKKAIFPGSCLPSVSAIMDAARDGTDLTLHDLEDMGPHYARTLCAWRARFEDRLEEVRSLGFDERFVRMWRHYFCYCEAAFLERRTSDVLMLLTRPRAAREPLQESPIDPGALRWPA